MTRLSGTDRFWSVFRASLQDATFVKLSFGNPTGERKKLIVQPVFIRGERCCSVVSRFATRDETKNYSNREIEDVLRTWLGDEFRYGYLITTSEELQLDLAKGGQLHVKRVQSAAPTLMHDRKKERWVDANAPYLQLLGVTDNHGKVRERMGDKFRQIERFIDLFASGFLESGLANQKEVSVCDMGAGKGYLTFATYDFLQRHGSVLPKVSGVEARRELVDLCNQVAAQCGFEHLAFVQSAIDTYPLSQLDVLIALHACNTATDDALCAGVRAGARLILAAPCCHKELRSQLSASGPLRDVLRHGIFAERHAEMATDALRALLLERAGYKVRVTEFVAAEHTAKNVMLIATKRQHGVNTADLDARIAALKSFYGIQHQHLEELYRLGDATAASSPVS